MTDFERSHLQERETERSNAIDAINEAIDTFEQRRRELDPWGKLYVMHALTSLSRGAYLLARAEAEIALTPPANRRPAVRLPADPILNQVSITRLRGLLHNTIAQPVRVYPHFGVLSCID